MKEKADETALVGPMDGKFCLEATVLAAVGPRFQSNRRALTESHSPFSALSLFFVH